MANKAKWYRRFYDFFVRKWFITSIFFSLSSLWFLLLQFWGRNLSLVNAEGKLTSEASGISLVLIIINVLFSIIKTYSDKRNEDGKRKGHTILSKVLDELCAEKKIKLSRYINGITSYAAETDKITIIDPGTQISEILGTIQSLIDKITGMGKNNIGISLIIKTNSTSQVLHENWECLSSLNIDDDLSINDLLLDQNSTVRHLIDEEKPCIFWPDKYDGYKKCTAYAELAVFEASI